MVNTPRTRWQTASSAVCCQTTSLTRKITQAACGVLIPWTPHRSFFSTITWKHTRKVNGGSMWVDVLETCWERIDAVDPRCAFLSPSSPLLCSMSLNVHNIGWIIHNIRVSLAVNFIWENVLLIWVDRCSQIEISIFHCSQIWASWLIVQLCKFSDLR